MKSEPTLIEGFCIVHNNGAGSVIPQSGMTELGII